jgi:hypothetical protein
VVIPVGAEQGWEAAVFNQFSAVAQTIAAKLRIGARAAAKDQVGGATYTFTVYDGHPHRQEVVNLLARLRSEMDELWTKVSTHNQQHPVPVDAERVCLYFGQNVMPSDEGEDSSASGADWGRVGSASQDAATAAGVVTAREPEASNDQASNDRGSGT